MTATTGPSASKTTFPPGSRWYSVQMGLPKTSEETSPRESAILPRNPARPCSAGRSGAPFTGEMSSKTAAWMVAAGSAYGCIRTVTTPPAAAGSGTVKCSPSILWPSARTETRYLPAGSVSGKSPWLPCV